MGGWRTRMGWAMNRGRTIEREAAGLRESSARLAAEPGDAQRGEAERSVRAMRDQLAMVERLLSEMENGLFGSVSNPRTASVARPAEGPA